MKINRRDLSSATNDGIITEEQEGLLWEKLKDCTKNNSNFSAPHIVSYFGGLVAIAAMTIFMTLGWMNFGSWGIFWIGLLYMAVGLAATQYLYGTKQLQIPAGIIGTFVIAVTPLVVYGFQSGMGWWAGEFFIDDYHRYVSWIWIYLELATLAVAVLMLFRYRIPFMVMPVAITLWYMSMDSVSFIVGDESTWDMRKLVSIYAGLGIIALALYVDFRSRKSLDYAFWLYLVGVVTFWGALSLLDSGSEVNKFLYMCVNVILIVVAAMLNRRVFAIFGALGIFGYLGHLSFRVFDDSMLFPIALSFIGFAIFYLGFKWIEHESRINEMLSFFTPKLIREVIESRR